MDINIKLTLNKSTERDVINLLKTMFAEWKQYNCIENFEIYMNENIDEKLEINRKEFKELLNKIVDDNKKIRKKIDNIMSHV